VRVWKIFLSALKKPVFYDETPALMDFGWYSDLPMEGDPYYINNSIMYFYNWIDYHYRSDFEEIMFSYFNILEKLGYKFIHDQKNDDAHLYLFEGNNLSVVFGCTSSKFYIDVAPLVKNYNTY